MIKLTPQQSHYALQNLLSQRHVRISQVTRALQEREKEIHELRQRLASLEALGAPSARPASASRRRKAPVRRRRLSPKVRALRRRQGQYMGFVRRLTAAEKARVRSVREKQGIVPAIQLAASLARK